MSNIFFDLRWKKTGGIGRFCDEISSSRAMSDCKYIYGGLKGVFTFYDPLYLSCISAFSSLYLTPGYNAPLFSFGKAVITLHDLMHIKFPLYSGVKNKVYYEYIVKRAVRSAPLVFTVSEFTRHEIALWADISLDKIVVVPNGVDHKSFHSEVKALERYRPYFFYVGNNKEHKNLDRLIRAFAASQLNNSIDLVVSSSSTDALASLVLELGLSDSVVFLSGINEEELPSYYKGAVGTILVSLYEGFGLPILESMAVGTPVITSNITAMPEVAGDAAILVNPYDIDAIKQALVSLYNDKPEQERLSKLGIERAQCFSWDKSREIWDRALQPILESL